GALLACCSTAGYSRDSKVCRLATPETRTMKSHLPARPRITKVVGFLIGCGLVVASQMAQSASADEPIGELARRLASVKFEQYAAAPGYCEGPIWRNGELLFCSGALWRVGADKKPHKYLDIGPAGTALRGDGHVLICDNKYK